MYISLSNKYLSLSANVTSFKVLNFYENSWLNKKKSEDKLLSIWEVDLSFKAEGIKNGFNQKRVVSAIGIYIQLLLGSISPTFYAQLFCT